MTVFLFGWWREQSLDFLNIPHFMYSTFSLEDIFTYYWYKSYYCALMQYRIINKFQKKWLSKKNSMIDSLPYFEHLQTRKCLKRSARKIILWKRSRTRLICLLVTRSREETNFWNGIFFMFLIFKSSAWSWRFVSRIYNNLNMYLLTFTGQNMSYTNWSRSRVLDRLYILCSI